MIAIMAFRPHETGRATPQAKRALLPTSSLLLIERALLSTSLSSHRKRGAFDGLTAMRSAASFFFFSSSSLSAALMRASAASA